MRRTMRIAWLVRHAKYGDDGRIHPDGVVQMGALARCIQGELNHVYLPGEQRMTSSSAPRAIDAALVLWNFLGITFEALHVLNSERRSSIDRATTLVVPREGEKVTITVTHLELVGSILHCIIDGDRERSWRWQQAELPEGSAWRIDFEAATITRHDP